MGFVKRVERMFSDSPKASAARELTPDELDHVSKLCENLGELYNTIIEADTRLFSVAPNKKSIERKNIDSLANPFVVLKRMRQSGKPLRVAEIKEIFKESSKFKKCLADIERLAVNCYDMARNQANQAAHDNLVDSAGNVIYCHILLDGPFSEKKINSITGRMTKAPDKSEMRSILEQFHQEANGIPLIKKCEDILAQFGRGRG